MQTMNTNLQNMYIIVLLTMVKRGNNIFASR